MLFTFSISILALGALVGGLSIPGHSELAARADVVFPCLDIDHWVKHERNWIQASSTDGCMALETSPDVIWALNKLDKPKFISRNYPNLVCSLDHQQCRWTYSPLDPVDTSLASRSEVDGATDSPQKNSLFAALPCEIDKAMIGSLEERNANHAREDQSHRHLGFEVGENDAYHEDAMPEVHP